MKNRAWILSALVLCMLPLGMQAQDDMYFIPKKKTQTDKNNREVEKKETSVKASGVKKSETKSLNPKVVKSSPGYTFTPINKTQVTSERDVDEYNRRYHFELTDQNSDDGDGSKNGWHFEPVEEDAASKSYSLDDSGDGHWVGGFDGSSEDYEYARRLLVFRAPSAGVPVSSRLYWDLCYGPNSIYWNVYDDGLYAYAFPTAWNPYYYGPWRNNFWWNYHYGSPSWGWTFSFNWGWHYPYYSHNYWPYYHYHSYYRKPYRRPYRFYSDRVSRVPRSSGSWTYGTASRPTRVTRPGSTTRPGSLSRPSRVTRPGSTTRPGSLSRPSRVTRPGSTTRPGNLSRPSRVTRPGSTTRPGNLSRPSRVTRNSQTNFSPSKVSRPVVERRTSSHSGVNRGGNAAGRVTRGTR